MDYTNQDVVQLANIIFGEAANQPYEVMHMVGSSVLNRKLANKEKEFGLTIGDIGQKGYYAVINRNEPYTQARTGKFKDDISKNAYKKAFAIASGLVKGTIEPRKGQFFFKEDEIKKLKKNPKKFNFKAVKEVDSSGDYRVFSY
jgi:spore germination cell wall hydrolase CwlJ-like protein